MMGRVLRVVWTYWKAVAQRIGDLQARLLLSLFYFVVFGLPAVGVKALSDPLRLDPAAVENWLPRPRIEGDAMTLARRQF